MLKLERISIVIIVWTMVLAGILVSYVLEPRTEDFKLSPTDGAAGDWFGMSVCIDSNQAIIGAPRHEGSGVVYVFKYDDGTGWTEQSSFTASDTVSGDWFGYPVCISGDRLIVGANRNGGKGAAYIFYYDGNTWTQETKLTATDGMYGDRFGTAAISGDYAIVGADLDDDKGTSSGSVYIYHYNDSIWEEEAKLIAGDGAAGDLLGYSVCISGDRAIAGARGADVFGRASSGAAYVFRCDSGVWTEEAKLTATDGVAGDQFGTSVCISGYNAILGAPYDDDKGTNSGAAYVFQYNGVTWEEQAKLVPSDAMSGDLVGSYVYIDGDYAIISAPDGGTRPGAVYIFYYDGTEWIEQEKLIPGDGWAGDDFGTWVSSNGSDVIVGAKRKDDSGTDSGAAYVYTGCIESAEEIIISATIELYPDTLNLKAGGKWITCYIELPEGYDVGDIDVSTVMLEDIPAEPSPTGVGDEDGDGIPDLMVKFDRQELIDCLDETNGDVISLTVSGLMIEETLMTESLMARSPEKGGKSFEGEDTAKVISTDDGKGKGKPCPAAPVALDAPLAYPQPCNPEVWIPYTLGQGVEVNINIYNTSGQLIRTLKLGHQDAGAYTSKDRAAHWDGRNERGEEAPSGVYFYKIQAGDYHITRKIVMVK